MSFLKRARSYLRKQRIVIARRFLIRQIQKKGGSSEAGPRTPNIQGNINYVDRVVQTPYNYETLCVYSLFNPVLRMIHDAIIREALKPRENGKCYDVVPRFTRKCEVCGQEYMTEQEKCTVELNGIRCPGNTRSPLLEQKRKAESFLANPNESSEIIDIFKSILRFSLAVDDWYISIAKNPIAIYVEDSRHMRVVADELGRLGNGEYFCPSCIAVAQESGDPVQVQSANQIVYPKGVHCPKHPEEEPIETAYVYQDGSSIKARFGKDEVIHKFLDSWLPDLYGHSKVVAVLRQIRSVTAMDKWNFDTYSTGKLGQIIAFKKMDKDEVFSIAKDVEEETQKLKEDADTGEVARKLRTLYLATEDGIDVVDVMPPSDKMQSLEWWKLWREIAGAVYGVQPVFIGATEEGKTGYHQQMQMLVQNDATILYHQMIEEPFNERLFPILGVMDYVLEFPDIEEKNELADIDILLKKVEAVIAAANAEMEAELTEEGEVKISGKPVKQEIPTFGEGFDDKPKTEPMTEASLEATTKSGDKRYTVIEHIEE